MNKLKYKTPWIDTTDKLKQQLANLTDDDLSFPNGKEYEILGRLKGKVADTKEKLKRLIFKL